RDESLQRTESVMWFTERVDHGVAPFSYHALCQPLFRVAHITRDKIMLRRNGPRRHEQHIVWRQVYEARAARFTIGPFLPPAHIHARPVDKDTCGAVEQWNPLAREKSALALQPAGIAGQMPCLANDPMTGDKDGQWVVPQRLRHRTHGFWLSQSR